MGRSPTVFTGKVLGNIQDIKNICCKVSQVVIIEHLVISVGNRKLQSAEHSFLFVAGFSLIIFYGKKAFFFVSVFVGDTNL